MKKSTAFFVAALVGLGGCGERELILPGDRLDVRSTLGATPGDAPDPALVAQAAPVARLGTARDIGAWTHRSGSPEHLNTHARLSNDLAPLWVQKIGAGSSRRARISTDPVSDGQRIFSLDSGARLSAVSTLGALVWTHDLRPSGEKDGEGSGGGLAVDGGVLFATSGFGTLTALSAASGAVLWVQDIDAAPSGPPTVRGNLVYLVTRDNRAWAIDAATGRIAWQIPGLAAAAGFAGGAGPAVSSTIAVFPFSSGELVAVLRRGGVRLWSGSVSGRHLGRVYSSIGDFAADPVIAGDRVYAGTQSGRLVAMELNTGDRIWTAKTGAGGPVAIAGNSLWLVSDDARLLRVDAGTGATLWDVQLPYFRDKRQKHRKGIHAHFGPLLAGGRIIVASSDGLMRTFDPSTGAALGTRALPSGAATAPIVVGGTLYVVTADGNLRAFR